MSRMALIYCLTLEKNGGHFAFYPQSIVLCSFWSYQPENPNGRHQNHESASMMSKVAVYCLTLGNAGHLEFPHFLQPHW